MAVRTFVPSTGYSNRKHLSEVFSCWLSRLDFALFVTLNFNREHSISGVRHQFGQWLARTDRKFLGPKWYQRPSIERTFAFGIIENPRSNIHLHALVRLPERASTMSFLAQAHLLKEYWSNLQPCGSSDVQQIDYLPQLVGYICKQLHWAAHTDDCMLMSGEFHNHSYDNKRRD